MSFLLDTFQPLFFMQAVVNKDKREIEVHQNNAARWRTEASRMDDLVERAHDLANEKSYCTEFDDFMEELGLPRRDAEYNVSVDVTFSVSLTVTAHDEDSATSDVDHEEVVDAARDMLRYNSSLIDWSVNYAERA